MIGDGDLDLIFENGDFDTEATFSNSVVAKGWFTGRTEGVAIGGLPIEANDPSFSCPTSKVPTVKNGMTVTIDGVTYEVKRKQDLGTGVTHFILKT